MSVMKRIRTVAVTGVLAFAAALGAAPAAHAGGCTAKIVCGVVYNKLDSSYTVKIGDFGGGTSKCDAWNDSVGAYNCTHWWLPGGKSSKDIRGTLSDTDGFMVESSYWVSFHGGSPTKVSGFVWTKINNTEYATCDERSSYGAFCTVSWL
ncbi:hypothetical protein ACWD6R_36675 [Streptomyces sp. NPDC005151]